MKIIYMKETFDLLNVKEVERLIKIGKIKKIKDGKKYLVIETDEKDL
jgi:hypothetical protein